MTTQPELPRSGPVAPVLRLAHVRADEADFVAFVERYESRLRRLVLRRIGDQSEAEEITQETLLRAYQHRETFGTEDEFMAWSTVVAQRLVIDRVRVRGRSVAVAEVPETARVGRDTADIVVARQEARTALEALEAIPPRQAAILWAREVEGLHYDAIADRYGITEPAVRSLLHRGRRALRQEFKDRTGTLPLNGLVPFAPWLLALRAAGQLRRAAKATAKAAVGGTGATFTVLALAGVMSLSIKPGTGSPYGARQDAGTRPSTAGTTTASTPSRQPANPATAIREASRPPATTAGRSGGTHAIRLPAGPRACAKVRCVYVDQDGPRSGGVTFVVRLPDNPSGQESISYSLEHKKVEECPDLPANPVLSCSDGTDAPGAPAHTGTAPHPTGEPR